jgi:hypothetical protein
MNEPTSVPNGGPTSRVAALAEKLHSATPIPGSFEDSGKKTHNPDEEIRMDIPGVSEEKDTATQAQTTRKYAPPPPEVMRSNPLLERVQRSQNLFYKVWNWPHLQILVTSITLLLVFMLWWKYEKPQATTSVKTKEAVTEIQLSATVLGEIKKQIGDLKVEVVPTDGQWKDYVGELMKFKNEYAASISEIQRGLKDSRPIEPKDVANGIFQAMREGEVLVGDYKISPFAGSDGKLLFRLEKVGQPTAEN